MIAKNNRIRIFQSQNLNLDNLEQWPVFHETVHVTYMHAHTQYETIKKNEKKTGLCRDEKILHTFTNNP